MGTSLADSERAAMAEQQPLVPEQPTAVAVQGASPSHTLGQDVARQQDWAYSSPVNVQGEEEEEADNTEGMCVPQQGGVQLGARPASSGSPEGESCGQWATGHESRSLGGPFAHLGASPEPQRLPPIAKEEAGNATPAPEEGSPDAPPGQERPRGESGARGTEHACSAGPGAPAPASSEPCCIQAEGGGERECPICTELYDRGPHRPAALNCGHVLCGQCLHAIMAAASAADIGRMRCPICRQKTPMMEWEICRLQEELLLLGSAHGPALAPPAARPLPARRPGFCGGLEHHFEVRFHTSRMVGFLPCLRYPRGLIAGLARLRRRCRPCYLLALVVLLGAEVLSLLVVFLPIALLLLLFLLLDR